MSWADTLFIQQQFRILTFENTRKIIAREAYTTDIGPFERQFVLLCLVALLRTKRIGVVETGQAP